ncbi:hypothetical protein OIU77_028882 [Salix suchowensis]|uniref:Lipoprotein n=1 Tax=Salix suchowensis TaxID=1278906 RepID=A0ABQ9BM86_9ROSI|nr:hypothetical protein OIU77_028882 [Salix suchowensis]
MIVIIKKRTLSQALLFPSLSLSLSLSLLYTCNSHSLIKKN